MFRFHTTALAALLSLPASALLAGPFQTVPYEAPPRPELYVFGYGGLNWMTDFDGVNPTLGELEAETENGWGAGGGIGLRSDWLGGTRFEVEGLHRSNEVDDFLVSGVSFDSDGEAEVTGVTFNFIKEMVWGRLLPYLGFGIGYGNTDVDIQAPGIALDDGSSSFLWQVIAGLDFPYTERTSLFLEYRYMPISDFGLNVTGVASEWDVDDLTNHSAFAGIRYFF